MLAALDAAGFVVSLELRHSAVTERADVVFPVAPTTQKAGTFVNWEGRYRGFAPRCAAPPAAGQSDHRVLDTLADEMGVYLGFSTVEPRSPELSRAGHLGRQARRRRRPSPRPQRPTRCR